MSRKKSWLDYMNMGNQRGNYYQQFSWLLDDICKTIKKLIDGSEKSVKKPARKTISRCADNTDAPQQDTAEGQQGLSCDSAGVRSRRQGGASGTSQDSGDCLPADLNVGRRGEGRPSRGMILDGAAMPGTVCQLKKYGGAESDRREAFRNAVLWSEILGDPAAKKRHRKRMSQYYGNQGNADRG